MTENMPLQHTILYGSYTCPMVPSIRRSLERAQVDYEYINISTNADAKSRVREINNGFESVPTLEFPDGSTLTEPSVAELTYKLESLGYFVPPATLFQKVQSLIQNPIVITFGIVALLIGAMSERNNLLITGVTILLLVVLISLLGRLGRVVTNRSQQE